MKTLVFGASGFIGSAFLRLNHEDNIEVVSRSKDLHFKGYKKHMGDIKDKTFLRNLASQKFDKVINLAWEGLPDLSENNNRQNLEMHLNLIKVFSESGTRQFDFAGSCLEYGDFEGIVNENNLGSNLSDFATSKLMLLDYLRSQNISHRWFRIFYAYGPKQHINSLLASAYISAKANRNFELNNPNISRDFIYVNDVALAIKKLTSNMSAQGVFNIGSGVPTNISLIVSKVYEYFGLDFTVLKADPNRTLIADISRIKEVSGWNPEHSIAVGVDEYIKWANKANL
jgi:nucleoside-diphosphate-sugar epimerase